MLYNAAFESELLLEGHILLWTLNELGGRQLNLHEDSTFSLLLLYVPINSRFTTGLPQPPTYRVALLACTIACIYEAARTYLLESLPGELKRAKTIFQLRERSYLQFHLASAYFLRPFPLNIIKSQFSHQS